MKKCSNCQAENSDNAITCQSCGYSLSTVKETLICEKCGSPLSPDGACPNCNSSIPNNSETSISAEKNEASKQWLNKFQSYSFKKKQNIILVTLIIAFILGFSTHYAFGVKRSTYNSVLKEISTLDNQIKELHTENQSLTKKCEEYEAIIQPYKDLSNAELEEKTAAANLKAEQDKQAAAEQKAAQEQKAAEEKAAAEKAAAEKAAAEKAAAEKAAAEKAAEEKKGYDTGITYNQLARTPDDYKGKKVKFKGKVVQVLEGTNNTEIRLAVNSDYDRIIYCSYAKSLTSSRVLEDDIITVYGTSAGLLSYESTLGSTITIPSILVQKIDQ